MLFGNRRIKLVRVLIPVILLLGSHVALAAVELMPGLSGSNNCQKEDNGSTSGSNLAAPFICYSEAKVQTGAGTTCKPFSQYNINDSFLRCYNDVQPRTSYTQCVTNSCWASICSWTSSGADSYTCSCKCVNDNHTNPNPNPHRDPDRMPPWRAR